MSEATKLRDFIEDLDGFQLSSAIDGCYNHIGATLADAILQARISYEKVVKPRVDRLKSAFPNAKTTSGFQAALQELGISQVLRWAESKKTRTLAALVDLLVINRIETETELRAWISVAANEQQVREIKGIGNKTIDYLKILCGIQSVAVDIHLERFVEKAGISPRSYEHVKNLLMQTAEEMNVPYSSLDYSIWKYMSTRRKALPNKAMRLT